MSSKLFAVPVWAGVAIRMADGTLFAVEIDDEIEAIIKVDVEQIETTGPSDTFRTYKGGDMHVNVSVRGIGRKVARFGADMGASRQRKTLGRGPAAVAAREVLEIER